MPASAFTNGVNHTTKSVRPVFPIDSNRASRRLSIACLNPSNDGFMFRNCHSQLIQYGSRIKAPISLRLWLDRIVKCQEPWTCTRFDDLPMKGRVEFEDSGGIRVAPLGHLAETLIEILKLPYQSFARPGRKLGCQRRGETLQVSHNPIELTCVLFREGSHNQPGLPASRGSAKDKSLLQEAAKRIANRSAANPEALCQICFHNHAARCEPSLND